MSRAGSSGGGRSSLGYLFEPEEITPIHTEKAQENGGTQDGKIAADEAADQEPYPAPQKREDSNRRVSHRPEDSNPIVSHMPASNIYHTNQSGNNSGLLITPPRKCTRKGNTATAQNVKGHGRRSLPRHHGQLRRQEPAPRGRGCALPGAAFLRRRPAPAVLSADADAAPPRARARDRDVLRPAGDAGGVGPGCFFSGSGAGAGAFAGGRGRVRGVAARRGEEGAEAFRAADVPGGRRLVQPRRHLHGHRLRVLPLRLANGGRGGADGRDAGHVRALRRRSGRDGVLGAVGAPGAVARLPVAHARVSPPAPRRAVRAQRRVRHHQRRAGHLPARLRLLPPRPRARALFRRGPWDYAVRHGLHVRPRRPGPPPLPRRPHRECALLPASGCGSQDTPHGQVRGRTVWAFPGTQGAGGRWWPGRAGQGAREDQPESEHLNPRNGSTQLC